MTITDISPQVKRPNRVSVFIDGNFAFGMSDVDVLYYRLKIGDELTQERYNEILQENIYNKAKDKAIGFLGYRARSEKELRDKLASDFNSEIIDKVIEMLKKYGYVNDEDFAKAYIRDCLRLKGWGENRIALELYKKGISRETMDEAMPQDNELQLMQIEKLLLKRLKGKTSVDFKERKKHYDFLARRGYKSRDINQVFEKILTNDDNDFNYNDEI